MDATILPAPPEEAPEAVKEQLTQKEIRCRRLVAENQNPSPRYVGNTPKEELLLEHVREFEDQFVNVYGNRFLFLCPPNEYGVPKFLPSTIRPTHLPYQELYEYKSCSKFLADFFNYDELSPPDRYPSVIPAPASVLTWQAGDCFDLSIALASLLIGVGYDAYCVSGNEARSACPQLDVDIEEAKEEDKQEEDEFVIPKKPPLRSEYLEAKKRAEEADLIRLQEEEMKSDSEDDPSSDEDEHENRRIHCWVLVRKGAREVAEDMYLEPTTGRIYSVTRCPYLKIDLIWNHRNLWVNMQVCGASHVQLDLYNSRYFEYVMLDAENLGDQAGDGDDTGYYDGCQSFCTLREPLDRFWSAFQTWNQRTSCDVQQVEVESLELLGELRSRPYMQNCFFVPQVEMVYGIPASDWDSSKRSQHRYCAVAPDEDRRAEQTAQILDLPSPWSERPDVPRERFHARCYQGEKTIFYHKCKVEQYAPYTQDDGLIQRITLYKDVRRQIPLEIRERFKHRKDKLIERKRRPMQNETIERFLPGRPSTSATVGGALKEFREISALSRELIFYKSRLDGLVRSVEIIGRKMFEYFEDRDDRLIYHSVTLDPTALTSGTLRNATKSKDTYPVDSVGEVPIKKMTEKFRRNPEVPADEDIAKISFYLTEQSSTSIYSSTGKIRVDYHREPGSLTFRQCMYHYEDGNLRRRPPNLPQPTQAEVHKLLQMQSTCRDRITSSHNSISQELTTRRKDEISIRGMRSVAAGKKRDLTTIPGSRDDVLEPSVYDLARESARVEGSREGQEEEKQEEQTSKVDILAPYLVDFVNKETGLVQLDSLQAELVAKKCTTDFRKRLTDRAEIIQRRLEEEQELLRKRRAQMQRRGDSVEKDEQAFAAYQDEAMFRTQILEQRLARHEMQAIEKFQELERMLQEDPRLAAMWQKEPAAVKG